MKTVYETPVLTAQGVIQTVRNYNYDNNEVIIERQINGKTVSSETFYMD